ncbi:hypothetical protein, partial [Bacillus cereus]|uniref:hypothetical protein n=2 Tax=Bacillus TaxID=1386 RepID=UPI00178C7E24
MSIETLKREIQERFTERDISHCSYDDDNDVILVKSEIVSFDFDEICQDIVAEMERVSKKPKSFDALYINVPDKVGFVEFKNSDWSGISKERLKNKIYDTLALIISEYGLSKSDLNNVKIYLVHRPDKSASPTHMWMNGKCPPEYKFIEETS